MREYYSYRDLQCYADKCTRRAAKRRLCDMHYKRLKTYGDPNFLKFPRIELDLSKFPRNEADCILWPYSRSLGGYARQRLNGELVQVSRIILEEKLGRPLLPNMNALHSCDTPPCLNPDHLFEGSDSDNMLDMWSKGRHPKNKMRPGSTRWVRKYKQIP